MKTKEELLKMLREDAMYQKSLAMASNDEERKNIESVVEGFVARFASAVIPALESAMTQRSKIEPTKVVTSGSVG